MKINASRLNKFSLKDAMMDITASSSSSSSGSSRVPPPLPWPPRPRWYDGMGGAVGAVRCATGKVRDGAKTGAMWRGEEV